MSLSDKSRNQSQVTSNQVTSLVPWEAPWHISHWEGLGYIHALGHSRKRYGLYVRPLSSQLLPFTRNLLFTDSAHLLCTDSPRSKFLRSPTQGVTISQPLSPHKLYIPCGLIVNQRFKILSFQSGQTKFTTQLCLLGASLPHHKERAPLSQAGMVYTKRILSPEIMQNSTSISPHSSSI